MSAAALLVSLPPELRPQAAPGVWEQVLEMLPDRPGSVLDAGAGRGGLSWILHRLGYDVTCIDRDPAAYCAPELACQAADLNGMLPFNAGRFDAVLAVEVLEHLENPWCFLREAVRVLRAGGSIILTSPNVGSLWSRLTFLATGQLPYFRESSYRGAGHRTPIFPWVLRRCAAAAGAHVAEVRYSRVEWPTMRDVPRYPGRVRRSLLGLLPRNALTGEVAVWRLVRGSVSEQRGMREDHVCTA